MDTQKKDWIGISSNRTLTAKFLELIPKTFYFDAGQGGSVSDTRVTYCLGDPEITVLAQPDAGWKIEYWEAMLNGKWNMASDREYLIVDDYLYKKYEDGTTFYLVFQVTSLGTPVNNIMINSVRHTGPGFEFTVVSTYNTEVDIEADFSVTYDFAYLDTENNWHTVKNVTDTQYYHRLEKGKNKWTVFIPYSEYRGTGTGALDTDTYNIKWEFSGNNGSGNVGIIMGGDRYYFVAASGKL